MIIGKTKEVMSSGQVAKLTVIDIKLNIQSKCKRWRKEKEVIELLTDAKKLGIGSWMKRLLLLLFFL